ncbi:MAG: SNF2 helicase associated domain-containing protein, partial [Calditrichia bacterium]|nr:SNF2 helicase associated domain-containing protein [Calditrichia bacterium]
YLLYINRFRHKNMFDYAEKIGFIMEWLQNTDIYSVNLSTQSEWKKLEFVKENYELTLYLDKKGGFATFLPSLYREDKNTLIQGPFKLLTLDPMTFLYDNKIYPVESSLNNRFWQNFQNSFQSVAIPEENLNHFFQEFLPGISSYIQLNKDVFPFSKISLPLRETMVEINEVEDELWLKFFVGYGGEKYPLVPGEKTLFLYKNSSLVMLKRDLKQENKIINLLYSLNLEYEQGKWLINKQITNLDWVLNAIPALKKNNFEIEGIKYLDKYKIIDQDYKFSIKIDKADENLLLRAGLTIDNKFIPINNLKKQMLKNKLNLFLEGFGYFKLDNKLWTSLNRMLQLSTKYTPRSGFELDKRNLWMVADVLQEIQTDSTPDILDLLHRIREFKSITTLPQPKTIKGKLREYQKGGFAWLNFLNEFKFGGILADDMGLGKTVQILTLLSHLKSKKLLDKPILIIMPTTLLENWRREVKKFTKNLKVFLYKGHKINRIKKMQEDKFDI